MARIDSDKKLIKDIFRMWFRIPEYQRPYVWGSDQITELLDDVYGAWKLNPESQYFLGSMVLQKNEKEDGGLHYEEFDLLDGQQRLTTLFLITAVIRDLTPDTNPTRKNSCKESIYQMANPDDDIPERSRIIFDIRDKVRDFVNEFVKTDEGTLKEEILKSKANNSDEDISIRNMSNAINIIRDFFSGDNQIDGFYKYFRTNVLMIYVAAEELEDAFHLFTVMNNRGIKLRNSDILKAQNLSAVEKELRIQYAKKWENIEEYFSEDFDIFLSHLRTILVKQKAGYNLLKEFEENIYDPKEFDRNTKTYTPKPPLLEKGESTFNFIEKYFRHYNSLFDQEHYGLTSSYEIYNRLQLMQFGFEADYWTAPLLRYYDKYNTHKLARFLTLLDKKFSADWISGLSPTKRIENTNEIIKQIENTAIADDLFSSGAFDIVEQDLIRVLSGNIYGRRFARYILLKLDLYYFGYTTKFSPPVTLSIEHILPQNPNSDSQWLQDFTDAERENWTNKIGNLIFLSRRKNSSQGNKDFDIKKERYFRNNVELFSNSIRIFNHYSTWGKSSLINNHREQLKVLFDLYGISLSTAQLESIILA